MTAFPGAEASFTGFTSSHTLAQDVHASQHNLEQSEIVATQHKIGTGVSTPTSGLLLRGTGAGTSSWAQANLTSDVTGVLPQANGGTGTTLATGTGKAVYDTSPTISGAQLTSSPTLTTPIIADFTNANHSHQNTAGGGTLNATNALQNTTVTADKLNIGPKNANIITSETTTSTSYGDLATVGPSVTVTVGVNGIVLLAILCEAFHSTSGLSLATYTASGANTIAANDNNIITFVQGTNELASGGSVLLTGLTAGSTTFKVQYRTNTGTATFERRNILVIPL